MPTGPALEQLRELISILRQLSNAGPRDNSFKQWRQVTLTLLQRAWPGDQTRAVRFRRIPFSAPSSKADAKTIKDSFVRGVNEAIVYLEGLAQELEFAGKPNRPLVRPPEATAPEPAAPPEPKPSRPLVRPPEATAATTAAPPEPPRRVASPPQDTRPVEPSPWEPKQPAGEPAADGAGTASSPPPAPSPPRPAKPVAPAESGKSPGASRRLKDMLGFGDEGAAPAGDAKAASAPPAAPAATPPPPAAPPRPTAASPSPGPLTPAGPSPSRASRVERPTPPARPAPTPAAIPLDRESDDVEYEIDAILDDEAETDAAPPPATLREMLDRDLMASNVAAMRAARDVRSMAAMVDQLGIPPGRRAIVRAALIDLGQQMDAPPVHWATIRQALSFLMDYPQIARRIIPMLLPYLDEAA
jgi:hypothetical protein